MNTSATTYALERKSGGSGVFLFFLNLLPFIRI